MSKNSDFNIMFNIGPIAIPWYGFLIALGFVFFVLFSYFEWRKKQYPFFDFFNIIAVGAFFALFGARWWYLIFNPSDINGVVSFLKINDGRSILGSIFFCTIWLKFYTWKFASYIEFRRAFSILLPNILLAQAIGRWGNFFEQDVYGLQAYNELMFMPEFIRNGMLITDENGNQFYRQPLFLYESILNLLGWITITFILKNISTIKPGVHGSFYFFWYGLTRASLELFRDEMFIMKIGVIPTSFVLSIIFCVIGVLLIIYYQYFYENVNLALVYNSKEYLIHRLKILILFFRRFTFTISKSLFQSKYNQIKLKYYRGYEKKINIDYLNYLDIIRKKY